MDNFAKNLKELDEVTYKVQRVDATIFVARVYFDAVLKDLPTLSDFLNSDALVFLDLLFELKLNKIKNAHEEGLTSEKRENVAYLLFNRGITAEAFSGVTFIVERADKCLKSTRGGGKELFYVETRFILSTSKICEWSFSYCRLHSS